MAEETVTNIQEQPIPPKQKLWSALSDAGYYTKAYGDFDKQFSSPDQINKLYSTLKAADYYTKSGEDFNSQFFATEKKNPIGNVSPNGVDLSGDGLNPFQNSQAPTQPYDSKTANDILSKNKNIDWVKRLYEKNAPSIQVPGEDNRSTHLMADDGNGYVFPTIIRQNGKLVHLTEDQAYDYAKKTNTGIQLPKDQGTWFANNGYKTANGVNNDINQKGVPVNNPSYSLQGSQPSTDLIPVLPKNRPAVRQQQLNDPHSKAISVAQQSRQSVTPPDTQPEERGFMDKISQALYVPAIKQGFNDLIVSPAAGATHLIDRTIDKAYQGITGEKTPDWLRQKGFFSDVSKQIQNEYDTRDKPKNMVSDIAEGVVGTLPLMASMFTGEGEVSMATKAPQLFGRLAKTLATTNGLTAYKDATDNHEGYLQSLEKGAEGAAKGGVEGQFMEAQMLIGGALGKKTANALAERGWFKGGKATQAILHALSVGTVFGGTSAGEDLLQGKDINTENALKQFGTGLAFELIPTAKGINDELKDRADSKKVNNQAAQLAAVTSSASNLNGESAIRTLINTPIEQIAQVNNDVKTGHEDLYADSIEKGAQAYETKDNQEKKDLYTQQLALKAQGDIKMIADKVSDPKTLESLKNEIYDNNELSDTEVQDLHDKLDALAPEKPKEEPAVVEQAPVEQPLSETPTQPIANEPITPNPETPADVQGQPAEPAIAQEDSVAPVETPVEEVKSISNKTDEELEKRQAEIEGDNSQSKEFNAIDKELEKRERNSVFSQPLTKVGEILDGLRKKDKEKPNGFGTYIERRDVSESKAVVEKYLSPDEITDAEIKSDFANALFGNPDTWYADGLKLRESFNLANERGIDLKELKSKFVKRFERDGFSEQEADAVLAKKLSNLQPKEQVDPIRQKAIDAITHGIIGNGERAKGDTSPRFDLGMDTREQKAAIRDITNGKYDTAPAKKMIDKVSEFETKGEYPIIEGLGGKADRSRFATADQIQQHIDASKQFKLAKEQNIEANNQGLKDLGITHEDIQNYENYRNAGEPGTIVDNGRATGNVEENVQRAENDKGASAPQSSGGEATQGKPKKPKRESLSEDELSRKKELRKKFAGQLNDITRIPTLLADKEFREYAGLVLKESAGDFKYFSKELIKNVGKKIEEHLPQLFKELQEEKTRPSKNEETGQRAYELGVDLKDSKETSRPEDVVEKDASAKIKEGYDVHDLIDRIINDKHAATDTEVAILNKFIDAKESEIRGYNERLGSEGATMGKKAFMDLMASKTQAELDFQDAADANRKTGRLTAQALNARKFTFNKENSLENMVAKKREALGGDKLTPEQLADITKKFSEMEGIQKQLEARVKKVESDNAKLKADQTVKKVNSDRPARRSVTKTELAAERSKIFDSIRSDFEKIRKSGQAMSDIPYRREFAAIAKHMPALLRNLAQDGLVRIEDVVDNLYDTFKGDLPDITKRDVTDLIAGKYNEVKPTKNTIQSDINLLKQQARLINQIEDLENGIAKPKASDSFKKTSNEKIQSLRDRIKEIKKQLSDEKESEAKANEPTKEEKSLAAMKKRIQDNIDKLNERIKNNDFSKEEPKQPVKPDEEVLNLRRKYDKIKQEWDIEVAKDALKQRSKVEKLKDDLLNIASLPRALKASLDFSAVLRQGLFATAGHPKEALTAFKEMFKQTFSEDNYKNWISDLKHSEHYELMKESDLYLSDKNDPKIIAREEEFTSNLADKIPVIGKAIAASERAYTGYLNVLRAGVFESQARELIKRGYTYENNPEVFKGVAKVVNVLTGRGDIPDVLGGKSPKVLSNVLFSPRFMAARIQTLYLWADPRLPREAKIMAAKDIGATLAMGATLLSLAALAGFKVNTDPRSAQFLKVQDKEEKGSTYYDILGGLPQYVKLLSQIATGKTVSGNGKVTDLSAKRGKLNPWGQTRGDVELKFMRGKLSPVVGSAINLQEGKDVVGQPYHLWPDVPKEFIPLPYTDVQDAYKVGGIDNALKVFLPAQFGIGVSSY